MSRVNCWQYKKCGRHQDGANTDSLGTCPAATEIRADGINGGMNGGRACWAVSGTLCGGEIQGTFATKLGSCMKCDFYRMVCEQEGRDFETPPPIHPEARA